MRQWILAALLILLAPFAGAGTDPLSPTYKPSITTTCASYPSNIWVNGPFAKVLQTAGSAPTCTDNSFSLTNGAKWGLFYGTQNEFIDFQVHFHDTGSGTTGYQVLASAFTQTAPSSFTIHAPDSSHTDILVYREGYVNVATQVTATANTYYNALGEYPDPLIPTIDPYFHQTTNAFPFTISAGNNQSAWVDVHIPSAAPSGYYSGTITVQSGCPGSCSTLATLPIILAVWQWPNSGFMPSQPTLNYSTGTGFSDLCVQAYGSYAACSVYPGAGGNSDAAIGLIQVNFGEIMLDHRLGITNPLYPAPSTSFTSFEATFGPLFNGTASTIISGAKVNTAEYWWGNGNLSFVQNWMTEFQGKGWVPNNLYNYTCDEPPSTCAWADINTRATTLHAATPPMPSLVTTNLANATTNSVLNGIDIMVPIISDLDPQGGTPQRSTYNTWLGGTAGPKRELWSYQSCAQQGTCGNGTVGPATATWPNVNIDGVPIANRAMEWMSYRNQVTGELYFATTYCWQGTNCTNGSSAGSDPWVDAYAFGGWGNGYFYPGISSKVGTVTTPFFVPSMRLKLIRDGMQDYEYMNVLNAHGQSATVTNAINGWILSSSNFNVSVVPAGSFSSDLPDARAILGAAMHALTPFSTHVAASCSESDVQTAVNAASTGDTVEIPGNCTTAWATFVTTSTSAGITIEPVPGTTVIIGATSQGFQLNQGTSSTRITGFTCFNAGNVPTDYNGHCLQVNNTSSGTWRVDNWTFCAGGGACTTGNTIFLSIVGTGPGLIDHNNWQGNGSAWIQDYGDNNSGAGWTDNITPGGPNMVFIEYNTATNPVCTASTQGCQATNSGGFIQAYYGARTVIRNNKFTMISLDQHGSANGGNECSGGGSACIGAEGVRWFEIYNNDFEGVEGNNPANQNQWFTYMDLRAGAGVVFNNTFNPNGVLAASNQLGLRLREENTLSWPQAYQIGSGIGSTTSPHSSCGGGTLNTAPVHLWGNTGTYNLFNSPVAGNVNQNRDYFLDSSQPASINWEEQSGDTCSTTYAYAPYTNPHPLEGVTNPNIVISPSPVNFGTVNIPGSVTLPITVTNTGSAGETLNTPFFTITGTNPGDFTESAGATNPCTNGGTIAANGGACTLQVTFTPAAQATRTATLNIAGTVGASATLTGVGQNSASVPTAPGSPVATVSGNNIVLTWTASTGTPPITYRCKASTVNGGPYSRLVASTTATTCTDSALSPGTYYYAIDANNVAGSSPNSTQVQGTIVATTPNLILSSSTVNFPNTALGATSGSSLTLTNNGNASATSVSIAISGANAPDFSETDTCTSTMAAGANCVISITFAPSVVAAETATITVTSNAPTVTASMSGTGVLGVQVTPSLNFGNVFNNHTGATLTSTFQNNSNATVSFSSIAISGGDSSQFVVAVNSCGSSVAAFTACTVTVTFTPTSTGTKTSSLVYTFTGVTGSPQSTTLTGQSSNHKVKKGVTM